jgi:RNA polymerase-binding protein DksA
MSTIGTGEFKQRLLDEQRRLRGALDNLHSEHAGGGSLEDETQELAVADNHPGDVATETFDRELDEGLEEGAARQLAQIGAALARIENGTYGTCAICGKPIGEDRLRAVPWATLCIDDQRKQEQV